MYRKGWQSREEDIEFVLHSRLAGIFLARFSPPIFLYGQVVPWSHAFRPPQPHTLVIMISCQIEFVLTMLLQRYSFIVAYEHLRTYPSIETVLSFDLTVGESSRQSRTATLSTPMCRGCRHPRLSLFYRSWSTDPCLSVQTDVAVHARCHRSSLLSSPEPRTTPITPCQSCIVH
jgi:hypothetical protein